MSHSLVAHAIDRPLVHPHHSPRGGGYHGRGGQRRGAARDVRQLPPPTQRAPDAVNTGRGRGRGGGARYQQRPATQPLAPPVSAPVSVPVPAPATTTTTITVVSPSAPPACAVPAADTTATNDEPAGPEPFVDLTEPSPEPDSAESAPVTVTVPVPIITAFDFTDSQQLVIDAINQRYESCVITLTTASILRSRMLHNDSFITAGTVTDADTDKVINDWLTVEKQCLEAQLSEIEVLRAIFPTEMTVSHTLPLTVTIIVQLDSVDCQLELNFLLGSHYPLKDTVGVRSFIPPPFNQYFNITNTDAGGDSDSESLQSVLVRQSLTLTGDESGAIYSLIECARQWVDTQIAYLQSSIEQQQRITEQLSQSLSLVHSLYHTVNDNEFTIDGRGLIESEVHSLVKQVEARYGLSKANAKALLKDNLWNGDKIDSTKIAALPLTDCDSLMEQIRERYDEHSSQSLTCLSCLEDYQTREGVLLIQCDHFLCYQCYARYMLTHLNTGSAYIKCPGHKCGEWVDESLVFALLSVYDYQRYRRFLQDSFLTLQSSRWCVNERCSNVSRSRNPMASIICYCSATYCFSCGHSAHWPLQCHERLSYYSSTVVQDLRNKHDLLMKLEARLEDDSLLVIQTKPCPKCKTPWERSEGCNHIKCMKCSHHYCYVCLQDWAIHGISWFECPYQATREVRASKIMFSENDSLVCSESEILLSLVGRECEATNNMSRALMVRKNDNHAMDSLLTTVEGSTHQSLLALLSSLVRVHALLQHIFILLCQYKAQLIPHKLTSLTRQLLHDLNQWEYFIEIINSALLRSDLVGGVRTNRTMKQLLETEKSVVKYGKIFIETLKLFLRKEAKAPVFESSDDRDSGSRAAATDSGAGEGDDSKTGSLVAFFQQMDRASGKGGKNQIRFDMAPPLLFG